MTQRDRKISDKFAAIKKAHESGEPTPDLDDDEVTGVLDLALEKMKKDTEVTTRKAIATCGVYHHRINPRKSKNI